MKNKRRNSLNGNKIKRTKSRNIVNNGNNNTSMIRKQVTISPNKNQLAKGAQNKF